MTREELRERADRLQRHINWCLTNGMGEGVAAMRGAVEGILALLEQEPGIEGFIDFDEPPEPGAWVGFWNVPEGEMGKRYRPATLIVHNSEAGGEG